MKQITLPYLTAYHGPRLVPVEVVAQCKTYRDAVRMCYRLRLRTRMTNAQIAEECGCTASHVGDYINDTELKIRRNLPAQYIAAFEVACGNRCITQWLAAQANLTIYEAHTQDLKVAA